MSLASFIITKHIQKTGLREVITDLQRIGDGLSHAEAKSIDDKWAECSEN